MRTTAAALTCCLLIAALAGAAVVAGSPAASSEAPVTSTGGTDLATLQSDDTGNFSSPETIEIRIQSDGDARFVLSKAFPTETANQSAAFEQLAIEYENGEHGRLGYGTYVSIVDDVAAETGRGMELVDNGPVTSRTEDVGTLEYQFTWTNFANVNEGNLTVGDAFQTSEGLWLGGLSGDQQLRIQSPEGYSVTESPAGPQIDDDALVWDGPVTFDEDDLAATFDQSTNSSTFGTTLVVGLVVALIALTVLIVGWQVLSDRSDGDPAGELRDRVEEYLAVLSSIGAGSPVDRRHEDPDDPADESSDATGGTTAVTDAEPSPAAETTVDSQGESSGTESGESVVDPELLSDEERVQQLLEENGGRMKQANIVTETGWSNAKVSQLLSRMDDEDQIDKLRIGRENLITLPDVDVTDQN